MFYLQLISVYNSPFKKHSLTQRPLALPFFPRWKRNSSTFFDFGFVGTVVGPSDPPTLLPVMTRVAVTELAFFCCCCLHFIVSHGATKSSFHCQQSIASLLLRLDLFFMPTYIFSPRRPCQRTRVSQMIAQKWNKQDTSSHTPIIIFSALNKMYLWLTNPKITLKCLYWVERGELLKLTLFLLTSIAGPYGKWPPQAWEGKTPEAVCTQALHFTEGTEWPSAVHCVYCNSLFF